LGTLVARLIVLFIYTVFRRLDVLPFKDQRINIRLTTADLQSLQAKAIEEGLPYQSLISSILHKYVTGELIERKTHSRERQRVAKQTL